jgi:F-type H+-transporting ATPase subunit b
MFELNATLPIFVVMFLVFMNLLNSMVLKPIGAKIEQRQRKIEGDLEAAKVGRSQASELVSAHEKRIHEARLQAQSMVNDSQARAQQDRKNQLKVLTEKGQAQLQVAKNNFANERQSLISQLVTEEQTLVSTIVKKLLGDSVDVSIDPEKARKVLVEEAS